jgi:DNA-binding PadR family transcriptional regulator
MRRRGRGMDDGHGPFPRPGMGVGPGRGRGWRELWEERPPRADRGMVRYLILDAVAETPRHGYEIMAAIESKSGEAYRPSPGVVYPTLQLLEELGHVRVSTRDDKKVFAITAAGQRELDEHREDVASFYEQSEGVWEDHAEELVELGHLVRRVIRTFRRSARRGRLTPSTMAKGRAILEDAIKKLEALLEE